MSYKYEDLVEETRKLMVAELEADIASKSLHVNEWVQDEHHDTYIELLKSALQSGTEFDLEQEVRSKGILKERYTWHRPDGRTATVKVPEMAAKNLACGDFNRFYMRAICLKAKSQKQKEATVYRAMKTEHHMLESNSKVGNPVEVDELMKSLKRGESLESYLRLPPGPISGLTIKV